MSTLGLTKTEVQLDAWDCDVILSYCHERMQQAVEAYERSMEKFGRDVGEAEFIWNQYWNLACLMREADARITAEIANR